ncbi:MAG: hypothetical protein IRD7MM_06155 [Candidatus Midichloria mitochondrii]|uniref:GTA baseplate fiber-binding domain-containing protein n=1 Tax=Candidatus Midichloria mitochondrii TaxID=234827 RepID=UPI00031AEEFF|nr:hypothetical protein [Candidatus Midichloria mitochondrii]MDJ1256456.1 hypothetical protein [Candidatus Midichloria mitochondrii]MDJ1288159.1 hypothetical protein [Candidatus Midichloria mitochondrii]MDJ1299043.1 hypothetical protein [Candidatus Midichloria mitochondrii]MDJ1313214.1 hypothetical protein [Candidatus Midichloria mitochondrii]MDJ1583761.1 hypothetical protein [Candidatus Midichloria mitochondrii]
MTGIKNEKFLNKGNLALIGEEIVQFRDAKLIGLNKYILTEFQRSLFGTEHKIHVHKINERFILLNDKVTTVNMPDNLINRTIKFKGEEFAEKTSRSLKFAANDLKPLPHTFRI